MHPFIANAQREAKSIFQSLDPRFDPQVYVVGLSLTDGKAYIGPSAGPFYSNHFANVLERAKELEKQDPEFGSYWGPDPEAGFTEEIKRMQRNKERRIRCRAIWKVLTEAATAIPEAAYFVTECSWPVEYEGSEVSLVLHLQKDVYQNYHHLKQASYLDDTGLHEYRRERSLIDAVAGGFLGQSIGELRTELPGSGWSNIEEPDRLLLKAAKDLMFNPGFAGGNQDGRFGLYEVCNNLSTLKYESQDGVGRIVFVRPNHPHLRIDVKLTTPVKLRSVVAVRKLLQMTSKDLALLCDADIIFGLGSVLPTYDLSTEDVFTVHFVKQFAWTLLHGAFPLMHVRYGEPSIRIAGFPETEFLRGLRRVFPGLRDEAVNRLHTIALAVAGQSHGCMLVITDDAKGEAERLKAQCTGVEPFPLIDSFIPMLTAIDGSILVDTEGSCHAVGVILDGKASEKCSSERGSRYNSAVRYVSEGSNRLAVVKSEDGAVSLMPEFPSGPSQ